MIKKLLLIGILPLLFLQCTQENDYLVTSKRAGDVVLGNSLETIMSKLTTYRLEQIPAQLSYGQEYMVWDGEERLMRVVFSNEELQKVEVFSRKYRTNETVRPGMIAQAAIDRGLAPYMLTETTDNLLIGNAARSGMGGYRLVQGMELTFENKMTRNREIGATARLISITIE
mgnify:CR=1 FL=1